MCGFVLSSCVAATSARQVGATCPPPPPQASMLPECPSFPFSPLHRTFCMANPHPGPLKGNPLLLTVPFCVHHPPPPRYAKDLEQITNGRKISPNPSDWRCDDTGVTENLWLNLSTGHIGSGRQVQLTAAPVGFGSSKQKQSRHIRQVPCIMTAEMSLPASVCCSMGGTCVPAAYC